MPSLQFGWLAGFVFCLAAGFVPCRSVDATLPAGNWTIVESANGSSINDIVSMTCVSVSDCWGVGRQRSGSVWQTLTAHWDGSAWSVISSPDTSTSDNNTLNGVACTSSAQCWAVGFHGVMTFGIGEPMILQWDGTSWTIYNSPLASPMAQDGTLNSVTCSSAADCWAVGYQLSGDFNQTLVYHWNGSVWSAVTSANTSIRESNVLNGVTCLSASDCWAVGNHDVGTPVGGAAPQATLTQHWDGTTWTIIPSPDPTTNYDILSSVSCVSTSDCTAVGFFALGTIFQTLVEHWDGTGWQVIPSPDPNPNQDNVLNGVACNSSTDCWAVGYFNAGDVNSPLDQTLISHWDGSSWSIMSSPNRAGFEFNFLNAVACVSAAECWAAGASDTPNAITLFEHYLATPVQLIGVVSRLQHGGAGVFDVDLASGNAIECRSGGTNGDYTVVFTFANPLVAVGGANLSTGTGSVAAANIDSNDAHNYVVNLTGITNAQRIVVTLSNVSDSTGAFSASVAASMGVLVGDTNGDGFVNSADIGQTKSQSGQGVTSSNFREDVNADGFINSADIGLVKSKSGTAISH